MKASSLQPPATFYRMIEAHGDGALIDSFLSKRPSISERMAAGKALRKRLPRSAQATYERRADRPDPVRILKQQDATLLQGANENDSLFLQIKEAQQSVLAPHVGIKLPFDHQGRRVVVGQRLTQGSPDIFLGWGRADGRDFYVRQLSELKGGAALEDLGTLPDYCGMCG
jgi:hypothetical protein